MAIYDLLPSTLRDVDIADTLNANGGDVTKEDFESWFGEDANINHWSFRKPYSTNADMFSLSDAQIRAINCGFTFSSISSYTRLPSVMDGDMNGWVYNLPRGGSNSPYRMRDFEHYYPAAPPMIEAFTCPSQASNQFEGNTITAMAMVSVSEYGVKLSDLGTLDEYYPGVYVEKVSDSSVYRRTTGANRLSSGVFSVEFKVSDLSAGDYMVYPFIAKNKIPETYDVGNTYYAIPNVQAVKLKIVSSNVTIVLSAIKRSPNIIDVTVAIKSTSVSSFSNNTMKIKYAENSFEDANETGELTIRLLDITGVPTNGTLTTVVERSVTVSNANVWANPRVWISLASGAYVQNIIPLTEPGDKG